jgi:hypothetical protein
MALRALRDADKAHDGGPLSDDACNDASAPIGRLTRQALASRRGSTQFGRTKWQV